MAPVAAAEAMEAYAEETSRLNREHRASGASDRKEPADIEKKIKALVAVIEDGGYARGMMAACASWRAAGTNSTSASPPSRPTCPTST